MWCDFSSGNINYRMLIWELVTVDGLELQNMVSG